MTTRHLSHTTIEQALRQLDPDERPAALTPHERSRSEQTLERIVSSDPAQADRPDASTGYGSNVRRTGRTRPRWVLPLGAAAVAAVAATSVLVPGSSDVAYASWSPKPVKLQPVQSAAAVSFCLKAHRLTASPADQALIAERRGGWAYVFVQLPDHKQTSCLIPVDALDDADAAPDRSWADTYTEGVWPQPRPRAATQVVGGRGGTREGALSMSEGLVGSDVVGVTVTTTGGSKVVASVDNGHYAAWWPVSKDKDGADTMGDVSLDLTLRDGTITHQGP